MSMWADLRAPRDSQSSLHLPRAPVQSPPQTSGSGARIQLPTALPRVPPSQAHVLAPCPWLSCSWLWQCDRPSLPVTLVAFNFSVLLFPEIINFSICPMMTVTKSWKWKHAERTFLRLEAKYDIQQYLWLGTLVSESPVWTERRSTPSPN